METAHGARASQPSSTSIIGAAFLAFLASITPGCASAPKPAPSSATSFNAFDGLISRDKPSFAAVGGAVTNHSDEVNVSGRVMGYPVGNVLAEATVNATPHSDKFRGQPGSYASRGLDGAVALGYDFSERIRLDAPMRLDDQVYFVGLSFGGSLSHAQDAFVSDQRLLYAGPRILLMNGPFQLRGGYLLAFDGELSAQQDFSGGARGHLGYVNLSFDTGSLGEKGPRLVLLGGAQYAALDQALKGNANGSSVQLTSESSDVEGNLGAILDFGPVYVGSRFRAGHARVAQGSRSPSVGTQDSQNTALGVDLLGGLDLGRISGSGWLPVLDFGVGYTNNFDLPAKMHDEYGGLVQLRWSFP